MVYITLVLMVILSIDRDRIAYLGNDVNSADSNQP